MELASLIKSRSEWPSTDKSYSPYLPNHIRFWKCLMRWPPNLARKVHIKQTWTRWIVQLECRWSYWRYLMCVWLPVSMFKLGSLLNIGDKFGVERKIFRCARFLLMLWVFFLIYLLEKGNRPHTWRQSDIFAFIFPKKQQKIWMLTFSFICAKSRFAPLCNDVKDLTGFGFRFLSATSRSKSGNIQIFNPVLTFFTWIFDMCPKVQAKNMSL